MPCRDFIETHSTEYYGEPLADKDQEIERLRKRMSFIESALCGTITALEFQNTVVRCSPYPVYGLIDYDAVGIKRSEFESWHKKHKNLDSRYLKEEHENNIVAENLNKELLREANLQRKKKVLEKLSEEDRQILGIR